MKLAQQAGHALDPDYEYAKDDIRFTSRNDFQRGYQIDVDVEAGLVPWARKKFKFVNGPQALGYREVVTGRPQTFVRTHASARAVGSGKERYEPGDGREDGRTTYVREYGPPGADGKETVTYVEWDGPEYEYRPNADAGERGGGRGREG